MKTKKTKLLAMLWAVERWYFGIIRALLALAEKVLCVASIKEKNDTQ